VTYIAKKSAVELFKGTNSGVGSASLWETRLDGEEVVYSFVA
jgi:hypothetical protein